MEQETKDVKILDQIVEVICQRRELGYEPVLLLMKKKAHDMLYEECRLFMDINSKTQLQTYLGLDIIVHPEIQHFTIVDNRSWYQ